MSGPPCRVCDHPARSIIDGSLRRGDSLSVLEARHGVSRSSLSRHRKHIDRARHTATEAPTPPSADASASELAVYALTVLLPRLGDGKATPADISVLTRLLELREAHEPAPCPTCAKVGGMSPDDGLTEVLIYVEDRYLGVESGSMREADDPKLKARIHGAMRSMLQHEGFTVIPTVEMVEPPKEEA